MGILYVEDDKPTLRIISQILARHFENVETAPDGEAGWNLYQSSKPEIIITDLKMPLTLGIDFIRKVRAVDQSVYILITSAYSESDELIESINLNVNHFFSKPIDVEKLLSKISEYISRKTAAASVQFSDSLRFDKRSHRLLRNGEVIKMTKTEEDLLSILLAYHPDSVSYESLEQIIWKDNVMTKNALRSHVLQLRKKIFPELRIENIPLRGYKIIVPESSS